jgi:catechol 2,3-dioxygenase-like lactoylglutathione lyase family enzyme
MIDHISLRVRDLAAAKEFYKKALAPLRYEVIMEFPDAIGMGADGKPDLWITPGGIEGATTHLAFRSRDNATVDAFHDAALKAGGSDNGPPGPREYHADYYGAFIHDPDGNNIEVVCHGALLNKAENVARQAQRAVKKAAKKAVKKLAKAAKKLAKPAKKGAKKKKR